MFTYYGNPFRHASHLEVGRVDMGVDYHGVGRIDAIGRCRIEGIGGAGWPGGVYIMYRLLRGRHRGKHIYVAEAIHPTCEVGRVYYKGQQIANFGANAAPGRNPGIEIGWSSGTLNETLAAATTGYHEGEPTPAGQCFARFLHHHGCPTPQVPNLAHGSEYPI
jgi:hypothetical protein